MASRRIGGAAALGRLHCGLGKAKGITLFILATIVGAFLLLNLPMRARWRRVSSPTAPRP